LVYWALGNFINYEFVGENKLHKYYTKQSYPKKPLKYKTLPKSIKKVLKYNFMEVEDFFLVDKIRIEHAYE